MANQNKRFFPGLILFGSIGLLFSISSMADTDVYITRDAKGNPVFSDTPSVNSEKKVIKEVQTIPETSVGNVTVPGSDPKIKELAKYLEIKIVSPVDDETVRQNSGLLSVTLMLEPSLRGDDQIALYMDGNEVAKGTSMNFALENVDRGSHKLAAVVLSAGGQELIRSETVTVHLLRVSTQSPSASPPPVAAAPPPPPTP